MKRNNLSVGTYMTAMKQFGLAWATAIALVLGAGSALAQQPEPPAVDAANDLGGAPRDARDAALRELREARHRAREAERAARDAERRAEEAERRLDKADAKADEGPVLQVGGPGGGQRVMFGNDVHVAAGQVVESAVAMGGSVYVGENAVVHDDVVSMGGNIEIAEGAVVEGDLVSMGGTITVAPGAVIKGSRVNMGPSPAAFGNVIHAVALPWGIIGAVASVVRILVLFALATLVVVLMPRRVTVMRAFLAERTGVSALAGFASLAAIIPLCILLVVTLIGIPLAPVAFVLFLLTLVVGFAVVAVSIGERLPILQSKKTMFASLMLGFVVLTVLDVLVPFIGSVLVFAASLVGAGAVLLSRFGQTRESSSTALTTLP